MKRGLLVLSTGFLSLLILAGASLGMTFPQASPAQQEKPVEQEPKDEASLWKRAEERFSNGQYLQALEDYKKLQKDYPKGAHVIEIEYRLAFCDAYRGRHKDAADAFLEFAKSHPKHDWAADALLQAGQYFQQSKQKDEAKAAFKRVLKEYPGSNASQQALWMYWSLVGKNFQFSVNQSYTEGQEVAINAQFRNIDHVDYRLFKLDTQAVIRKFDEGEAFGGIQDLVANVPPASRIKVKEWSEDPNTGKKWVSTQVKPDVKEAGLYLFEADHDEITVQVGIIVARYGIIVKSAPNRSVVFAVDRRVGRAVEGMALRFAEEKKRFDGKTDAQGLFILEKGVNGTVVGVKDGEIALSNLYTQDRGDEFKSYFFTDRPIYRPNQTIYFKGIHREAKRVHGKDGLAVDSFANVVGRKETITIQDPRGNVVFQKELTTNENGCVTGEMKLGDEPPLGEYYMYSSLNGYGQFRVEEYRKPEYEVEVKYQGAPYLQGDELKANVEVKYYFGSPVVAADVSYEIYRRQYYKPYWRWWYADWDFDGDDDDNHYEGKGGKHGGRWYGGYGELLNRGTGTTDAKGNLKVAFMSKKVDQDSVYTVVAKVVDKSRREVRGEAGAKVTKAQLEMSVSASKYLYVPGDKVSIKVRVTDMDGKPVAGQNLSLDAATAAYWRREKEVGYDYGQFYTGSSKTDEHGVAEFGFVAEKEGYIRIHAATKDRRDNDVIDNHWIWISGRQWSSTFQNFNGVDLITDKASYKMGETAQVLITSQHKSTHALFTVECDGLYRQQVVTIAGHSALVEVPIDTKRYAPNVYFSVTTLVGNEFLNKQKSVAVAPTDDLLNIKISMDKSQYRPREKAEVTVEVTDSKGKPVQAELALSMVDESIYALQEELVPDLRKFFFAKRWNQTQTNTSMHFYDHGRAGWGKGGGADRDGDPKPAGAAAPQAEGGRQLRGELKEKLSKNDDAKANTGGAMAETEVRGFFPDTWMWNPTVVTDARGRFTFTTAVPDSLTTWRTTVRGLTTDTKVGHQKHEVLVRKEVIIRLEAPRFFTQKDQCTISGIVHNYRDDVDEVKVQMEATGIEIVGDRETIIRLKKGEDKRIDWKCNVTKAGEAKITVKALTPKESDAMMLTIPVLPHGVMMFETKAGLSMESTKATVTLPKTAIAEATEMTISIAPSVASQISGALEFLAGYPYGCVEQTMSRFLPSVVAGRAMQQLGVKNDKLTKELPDMVAAGVQRLNNFQQADGGWGWWQADSANPFMTAYVVYGLAKAREADYFVDQNVFQRGVSCLQEMIKARKQDKNRRYDESPIDTRSYMVFALAEAGHYDKNAIEELYTRRGELSNYGKALVAITLAKSGEKEQARNVLANLDETAKSGESFCYWEGAGQRYSWMSHTIETTAYVLRAYVQADAADAKIHKIVRWLAANRRGTQWHSTKDTAAIVYALSDYVKSSGELDADYALTVKLNGREILAGAVNKSNLMSFDGTRVIRGLDVAAGAQEISIEKTGKGAVYYSVSLKYFNAADEFAPSKGTVSIDRTYSKVTWEGKTRETEELKDGATVEVGDIIEVTLDLDADGVHEYMMIEDPIPAGFEIQKQEDRFFGCGWGRRWNWWYSRIEARDDKVCVAATTMRGGHKVTYLMRAETPGDFRILPARAYNMYVPEIAGSGSGAKIKVIDKVEKQDPNEK